jgi:hypothetical protein
MLRRDFLVTARSPEADAANEELQSFLAEQVKTDQPWVLMMELYVSEKLALIRKQIQDDPTSAREELTALKEFFTESWKETGRQDFSREMLFRSIKQAEEELLKVEQEKEKNN